MTFLSTPRDRAALLILLLAIGILIALSPFLSGLVGAAVLYVVFLKPYRRLEKHLRPGFSATIILVDALVLVALPLAWIITIVCAQAPDAMQSLQTSDVYARIRELRIGRMHLGDQLANASGTIFSW